VREFVTRHFKRAWADEISAGFARQPVTVFVALRAGRLKGFAAYECTRKNFFGPTGVVEDERGRGLGRALLPASLWALRESGYAYAIIGGVGPAEFYARRRRDAHPRQLARHLPRPHQPRRRAGVIFHLQ
jgi:predicted N-acetyltransferase YhbS